MKIVDVNGFYSPAGGGVRSYVEQKFKAAARHGYDLTVVAPGGDDAVELRPGGRIVWLANPSMPFDANYRYFARRAPVWRAIEAQSPDVVEGSSPWGSGAIAALWPGDAVRALIYHQDVVAGYGHVLMDRWVSRPRIDALAAPYWRHVRGLSEKFDVTVCGGAWLARRLTNFGVHNPVAVALGLESGVFDPARRDDALRQELLRRCGVASGGRLLLAVGRFHPEKRHRTIIDGFALARRARPDLALVLAGDGLTRKTVERLARRAGGVQLLGVVGDRDRLAILYASADALIHGSGAETYGLVVAEAMASGLPVVVPDSGGAADLARRGSARVYATGDAKACATAILACLGRSMGGSGASLGLPNAADHFDGLFGLYESLMLEKSKILA